MTIGVPVDGRRRACGWRLAAVMVAACAATVSGRASASDFSSVWQAALTTDPTVASALAFRDAAQHAVGVASGRLRPQVNLQATVQRFDQTTTRSDASSSFSGPSRVATIQIRQAIYRPRDVLGRSIAEVIAAQAESKLSAARSDLFDRLATAWVEVAEAKAKVGVAGGLVASAMELEAQAAAAWAKGEGTRDALAEAVAQSEMARADAKSAELGLVSKLRTYRTLSRRADIATVQIPLEQGPPRWTDACTESFKERIMDSNPELSVARTDVQVSRHRQAQASSDHRPTVDLIGSVTDGANDTTNTLGTQYRNGSIGVQFVLPLYSGGATSALQLQAASQVQAAEAAAAATEQKLQLQLDTECASFESAVLRIQSSHQLARAAQVLRQANSARVVAGFKSLGDVAASEQTLTRRKTELIQAKVQLLKSQIRLLALLPGGDPLQLQWADDLQAWLLPEERRPLK